tara:strand:- start:52959 stop:54011 length:1053 start_codon:yes stop_codon:yes gene_type:complete
MPAIFIQCFAAFQLMAAPGAAALPAQQAVRVAQASPQVSGLTAAGRTSNSNAARLAAAQKRESALVGQMAKLRATYDSQLGEVDKLKKSRASWRRDRKLSEQKKRSQKTALALESVDAKLRAQRIVVKRARLATVRSVEAELELSPSAARTQFLSGVLSNARRGLVSKPKKISMPDLEFDEFADPEELLEQIALIERAEAKLAKEESSLERRENHYSHMDALRSKRDRAEELVAFENDNVRRSTGRTSDGNSRSSGDDQASGEAAGLNDSAGAPPEGGGAPGTSFEASSVVLSDVVDAGTQDALRRAHRSSSPRTKAAAAKRAHQQVQERLKRLRASKAQIQAHLRRHSK